MLIWYTALRLSYRVYDIFFLSHGTIVITVTIYCTKNCCYCIAMSHCLKCDHQMIMWHWNVMPVMWYWKMLLSNDHVILYVCDWHVIMLKYCECHLIVWYWSVMNVMNVMWSCNTVMNVMNVMWSCNTVENHQKQSDYDDSLILKMFAFQFANCYTTCFYIAFFIPVSFTDCIQYFFRFF